MDEDFEKVILKDILRKNGCEHLHKEFFVTYTQNNEFNKIYHPLQFDSKNVLSGTSWLSMESFFDSKKRAKERFKTKKSNGAHK